MTFQSVWWYPNYVEYGAGLNTPKTWPTVQEQYRRPHALYDLRYYDLPTEEYEAKLYYRLPRLGQPKYRATFRDKPHTVPSYYPEACPEGKPLGFHGRQYYEHGPPQFKYEGPVRDKLYWLERPPLLPTFPLPKKPGDKPDYDSMRGLNSPMSPDPYITMSCDQSRGGGRSRGAGAGSLNLQDILDKPFISHAPAAVATPERLTSVYKTDFVKPGRQTQDGVGYL